MHEQSAAVDVRTLWDIVFKSNGKPSLVEVRDNWDEYEQKVNTLWDERNFSRGAMKVLLGLCTLAVGLIITMFGWMLTHASIH